MSTFEVPPLAGVLAVSPSSVRREANDQQAARGEDRRVHLRLRGDDVQWLRRLRLKSGPEVSLVDFSSGGALIDTRVPLRPGSIVTLELWGDGRVTDVAAEVLRCGVATLHGNAPLYRGACAFSEPLALEALRLPRQGSVAAAAGTGAAWQKIVVRYREGETLKGYTLDFHPSRGHFSLWPSLRAAAHDRIVVPLARLKALFFVRDFAGNPERVSPDTFDETAAGRRIEVTFFDGEVVRATTLNYRPDGIGFFVTPADTGGNNRRVFVINNAIRHVRFPRP